MELPIIFVALAIALVLIFILIIILVRQNKAGQYPSTKKASTDAMGRGMGIGIAIGMGTGVSLGVALDNIGMGIALGTGVGVSLGVAFGTSFQKKENENNQINSDSYAYPKNNKFVIYAGLAAVLAGLLILGLIFFLNSK